MDHQVYCFYPSTFCHQPRWPNLGFNGKKWKDKNSILGDPYDTLDLKQEDYYLDEFDRKGIVQLTPEEKEDQSILKPGDWKSTQSSDNDSPSTPRGIYASIELSREDLLEAKKDKLFLGLLGNKKPFKPGSIWRDSCQNDYDCRGSTKCCYIQVARYHYRKTCRQASSQYYPSYW
jgi:hypothetical protein